MSAAGAGLRAEGGPDPKKRALAAVVVLLAVTAVAILLFRGDGGYRVTAEFVNAGQLVKGNEVKAGGVTVGSVKDIDVSQDGAAEVTLAITDSDYEPLRQGTRVLIKQGSLSGIANRYVDLQLGPASGDEIDDGSVIGSDQTATAVELDQIFDLFDQRTRTGLQDFFKGSAAMLQNRGEELRRGVHYLNPALSTGSRLFQELTRDDALLERFLVDSGSLVNALAERRQDLTGVVGNLNATFGALGRQQDALAESVERLPPFLDQARLFVRDGEPTIRDLSRTITRKGKNNDLIELIKSFPPLAQVAMDEQRVNGATRRGAFPETTDALNAAAPTIAFGRPYTPDFVGWMDDFSTTGGYDANGGFSRAWINFSEILFGAGPKLKQFRRCPGANELPAADGSNVFSAEEAAALDCDPNQRSVGP
jgi:phospholipid/cholesterol/gamma-HCH transport system substrate-binding protein